jgi:hypothetical protein
MNIRILTLSLLLIALCSSGISYAANIDLNSLDKVVLNIELKDGTVSEVSQTNKKNGHFAQAVENLLDYYYNIYSVAKLVSINDIPLHQTQFSKYAGKIDDNKKGLGYSNSPDIVNRVKINKDMEIPLSEIDPNTTTISVNGDMFRCTGSIYMSDNLTYLPFRSLFESLGYNVEADFNPYYKMIIATKRIGKEEIRTEVKFDSKRAYVSTVGIVEMGYLLVLKDDGAYISLPDAIKLSGTDISVKGKNISITTGGVN